MPQLKKSTIQAGALAEQMVTVADSLKDKITLDSAQADTLTGQVGEILSSANVPDQLQAVMDEAGPEYKDNIAKAFLDGVATYSREHGQAVPADLMESVIHQAFSTTEAARVKYALDSIASSNSLHHEPLSLQPNRAVVAILAAFGDAIPFAHYLPADISSNEARLAIMSHRAGNKTGSYEQNGLMDGVQSGDNYISTERVHTSKPESNGNVSGKITRVQKTPDTCDDTAGDLKLLRGRTTVYVQGRIAATEARNSVGTGNSPISGNISVAGVSYAIAGNINTDTGVYSLTTTPALPTTVDVVVEAFIDLERQPELIPSVISNVDVYSLYATPWHVTAHQSISSRTQMANELALDPVSESVLAIQGQFANERHYNALRKGIRLAALNQQTFDWGEAAKLQDSGRAAVWADLAYPLGALSQQMAIDTINHGITHLYVTRRVAAQLQGLPSTIFKSSGITARPGIFRVGRLFDMYDVYYTPKGLKETETSAEILCVGRATDVTRNPIVLGDAVAPTVVPLAINGDLRTGAGFYARNFTCVNPHEASARGFARIEVTNF